MTPWLPPDFVHPGRLDLASGHHLRPIRATDVDLDYPAVMGSRDRLWTQFGEAWGWPPATMTFDEDRADLVHHEEEIAQHLSFNYAIFDADEDALLGCVYIDPPEEADPGMEGPRAVVTWWVVDAEGDGPLDAALDDTIPRWLDEAWPFVSVRYGV
jgi:hypothetical protein